MVFYADLKIRQKYIPILTACAILMADSVAKVAEKALWNSILKQRNRGGRAFESMLRLESHS
jgi:hypothetical protein